MRRPAVAAAVVALLVTAILLPPRAMAHAFLVRTTPQAGERLAASPPVIHLQFSEPVAGGERIVVKPMGGAPVAVGPLRRLRNGVLQTSLPPLGDGVYIVSWQALSQDGDLVVGEFAFAVGAAGQLPVVTSQGVAPVAWSGALARWLFLVGLFLAVGGLASERAIWAPIGRRYALVIPPLPVGRLLLLALAGGLLQVLLLAWQTGAARADRLAALTTRPGLLALAEVGLVAYGLWLLPLRRARYWTLVPLGLAVVVAVVRGHAGAGAGASWWAIPANVLHLGAVALWFSALAHLVLVVRRLGGKDVWPALEEGVRRYAALALGLVALALASGVMVALAMFTRPAELVSTTYGWVLLVKLLVVAAVLGLAIAARRWALPSTRDPRRVLLRRLTRAEALLLLLAVAVAAVLAYTPPPRSLATGANLLGPPPMSGPVVRWAARAGWLSVYLAAAEDQLQVQVLAPSGDPAAGARVTVAGRAPDGTVLAVEPRACGSGCVVTAFPWQGGTTTFTVTVTSPEWEGGMARFAVAWPPQPADPALLARVVETMRAEPRFMLTERVTSGLNATFQSGAVLSGAQFIAGEPYAGGAEDVRPVPAPAGARALTLHLPGSAYWFYLEIDSAGRLERETVVTPGNLVERSFAYDTPVSPTPDKGTNHLGIHGVVSSGQQRR